MLRRQRRLRDDLDHGLRLPEEFGVLRVGTEPVVAIPAPGRQFLEGHLQPDRALGAGPAAVPAAQERWFSANVAVGQSDITQTVTPRPRGTLTAVIDTGGPTIQVGTNRLFTVTATAAGGFVENAGWEASIATKTPPVGSLSLAYVSDEAKTLLPGESIVATGRMNRAVGRSGRPGHELHVAGALAQRDVRLA